MSTVVVLVFYVLVTFGLPTPIVTGNKIHYSRSLVLHTQPPYSIQGPTCRTQLSHLPSPGLLLGLSLSYWELIFYPQWF